MLKHNILVKNIFDIGLSHPDQVFVKLKFAKEDDKIMTYKDLIKNANRYANLFKAGQVKNNQVVVIILEHSPELIYAFTGALIYGAIPSIFAPPSFKYPKDYYLKTLPALLHNAKTNFVLTEAKISRDILGFNELKGGIEVLPKEAYFEYADSFGPLPDYQTGDIALLQYSSGTTGLKKGVALSNQSVINQIKNYASAIDLKPEDKIASWLPLYHDMGFIACFVMPLVSGVPVVMISALDWVQNPVMLLEAIHQDRCTLCWLPNFAYNFLASRIPGEKIKDLSLASMRAFINCAEPISYKSHQLFFDRFKDNGVKKEALCTCYAMAENTFAISQGGIREKVLVEEIDWQLFCQEKKAALADQDTKLPRKMVSSGRLIPNNSARIVDDKGKDLPERHLGEIIIKSDSMLTGYYRQPELTKEAIKEGWYYTGDLGYLVGKELFVIGRKKDMLIVAGKNIYPADIEEIVSAAEGVYAGRVVAFGRYNEEIGTEQVVVLAEAKDEILRSKEEALKTKLSIVQRVRDGLECIIDEVVLLEHMWLMKSTSGKISRSASKEKYLKEDYKGEENNA